MMTVYIIGMCVTLVLMLRAIGKWEELKQPTLFDNLTKGFVQQIPMIAVISAFAIATGLAWLLLEVYYAYFK